MNIQAYIKKAESLLEAGNKSDGCTMPFSNWIHKRVNNAKLICAAHDFGSRGLIEGVRPGWHNNVMFFKANWSHGNHLWAIASFVATMPYALVRYNLGLKIGIAAFHVSAFFISVIAVLAVISVN